MEDGCECCKKWEDHYYWNHLGVERMHFCKIMIEDFYQRMSIPKKFVCNFKGEIQETLHLKGPSGHTWDVEVTKTSEDVLLQSGWSDFVKDHILKQGDLLVFKCSGNSSFDILMFDRSGCEKASSYFVRNHGPGRRERGDNPVENMGTAPPDHGGMTDDYVATSHKDVAEETPQSSPRPSVEKMGASKSQNTRSMPAKRGKRGRGRGRGRGRFKFSPENSHAALGKNNGTPKGSDSRVKQGYVRWNLNKRGLTDVERRKAMQLAQAIKKTNPCFISALRVSHVTSCVLAIPQGFVSAYIPCETRSVFLQTPNKKNNWTVKLITLTTKYYRVAFSGGWRRFVLDNNLEEGHVCLFELLTKGKKITMKVHISRSEE